jgi:uncharacterized protein YndB with AHSA1/START domain
MGTVQIGENEATFELAVQVRRRPEVVFALLADVQDAEPIPRRATVRMTKHPTGPTMVGSWWDERVRVAPGCWMRIVSRVTEIDPPRSLAMDFAGRWFTGHLTYTFTATADGCRLTHREVLHPRALVRPWTRQIARRSEPRLAARLEDIRRLLEEGE